MDKGAIDPTADDVFVNIKNSEELQLMLKDSFCF